MAKFDIKTVKPKFVVTTSPDNKIDVVVNKPIITSKNTKSFFQLKNTGGPRGLKGEQGEPGQDATIEVVSTTTGAAGTNASVVNQGTASAAQLAFTIPRGDKGETGPSGYSPTAAVSKVGDTATITITDKNGTTTASVSDGQDGAAGAPGQAATIAISSTETLPAGSPATVENVGSSSQASLAFGIPQGVAGQDGADGISPVATITQTSSGATISITDAQGTTTADVNNGADGQAATIAVGTVTTLQPNESAYVTNVGTSSAAIFDIGIPQGQKGESGSGSGDMTASTYDPNGTVASAGGIPDYVSSQLPTVNDATLTIQKNGTTVQTFTANQGSNATANITVPTDTSDLTNGAGYITPSSLPGDMTGATSSVAGAHGLVPAPAAGDEDKVLKGDGTWGEVAGSEVILYVNKSQYDLNITGGSSAFTIYTDSGYTTAATLSTITDATSAGQTVTIKTNDSCEMKVLGDLGTGGYQETYFSAVLANNRGVGKLTYSGSSSDWTFNPGSVVETPGSGVLTITQNGTSAGTFSANASGNSTIALTDTTYSTMTGATSVADGTSGLVPAPTAGNQAKVLSGAGTWVSQPTVNDGRITFSQNGNFLGEFSANTAHNSTIEIENIYADPIASSAAITPLVQTSMIADGAVTADKTNFSTYGLNTTVQIGTDVDDNTPVYRTTLGSNSLAIATSTWVLLGNLFGSGTGTVKTIYSLNFVLRDSGGTNFCAYGYDGGAVGGALGTSRPLLAKVLSNGNVLIACANDNFSAAKVRVTVEYTKN